MFSELLPRQDKVPTLYENHMRNAPECAAHTAPLSQSRNSPLAKNRLITASYGAVARPRSASHASL